MDLSSEFIFNTSRSGGKGGQNVNKVSSKVELRFHVSNSNILSEEQKQIISEKCMARITMEEFLQMVSQTERSQLGNKEKCIQKFYELIEKALKPKLKRKATKPKKSSIEERLKSKKIISEKKSNRKPPKYL